MITKPKGCYDLVKDDAYYYQMIENKVHYLSALYNYKYIRTPLFETSELFKRGVGESSDIVQKETYDFLDRSNRSLTLRPEGTAGVVRSYIENKAYGDLNSVTKYYYIGTMYRYERPGLGRNREFTQFGIEALGSDDPLIDAEVIAYSVNVLKGLGIDVNVRINNLGSKDDREKYKESLKEYLKPHLNDLCEDCRRRFEINPLRILDCKVDNESEVLKNAPSILDYQSKESEERFSKILEYLGYIDIDYEVDSSLVRGLDYYDYMVYELNLNDSLALGGGGRYNGLVKELGGPDVPCVGFACGIERIINYLKEKGNKEEEFIDVYIMAVNEEEKLKANILLNNLRNTGIMCETDFLNKGLKAQFKDADRNKARFLIILNSEDLAKGIITIKDNYTKEEQKLAEDDIYDYLYSMI